MKEYKFRGKDKANGKWLYGNLEIPLLSQTVSKHYIIGYSYGQYQKHEVDSKTVGQYIGLKDSNQVDIYEGDILNIPYNHLGTIVVKYEDGSFNVSKYKWEKCKVIGNIYDNPELMK